MKNLAQKISLFGLFLLISSTNIKAENAISDSDKKPFVYQYKGWYLDTEFGTEFNSNWNERTVALDLGYQFNRYFALEGGFSYAFGTTHLQYYYNNNNYYYHYDNYIYDSWWRGDIAAKGILPVTSKIDLYAKLGVAYTGFFGVTPLIGEGVSFHLSKTVSLNLGVNHLLSTLSPSSSLTYGTLGIDFKFK
ncbi:MAG: hypothetical protein A3F10_01305 [Coxiella sp. RIFCSPHIGHO2_12_FULL_42_15]|nr:MAG: hypothetical protein A3F10_01305 [Coxiella sp. RIFCSPHIGHO2_12_FULL_42_15]